MNKIQLEILNNTIYSIDYYLRKIKNHTINGRLEINYLKSAHSRINIANFYNSYISKDIDKLLIDLYTLKGLLGE